MAEWMGNQVHGMICCKLECMVMTYSKPKYMGMIYSKLKCMGISHGKRVHGNDLLQAEGFRERLLQKHLPRKRVLRISAVLREPCFVSLVAKTSFLKA